MLIGAGVWRRISSQSGESNISITKYGAPSAVGIARR